MSTDRQDVRCQLQYGVHVIRIDNFIILHFSSCQSLPIL